MSGANLKPGEIEYELGVPIPGVILPPEQWARTAIKKLPPPGKCDWTGVFQRQAPLVLDLGCGNGRFVVSSAVRRPTHDHLGVDLLPVVIRYATRRANQRGLTNVRFLVCGAHEFLAGYVPPARVAEIHLYHPQPFHDPTAKHRRLLTPEFLGLVYRALSPGGVLCVQTDDAGYWRYLRQVLPALFDWQELREAWPEDPHGRSRREIIALAKGLPIYRGQAVPRGGLDDETLAERIKSLPRPDFETQRARARKRPRRKPTHE